MKYGDFTRGGRQRGSLKILIYVVFRATRYECLSVSNISELSSLRFSELLLFPPSHPYHLAATAVVTNFSDLYRGRYFVIYFRLVVLIFTHK